MIDAPPPPPPPAVERPAPYAVSYGIVSGRAGARTSRVVVRVGGRVLGSAPVAAGRFTLQVDLPLREVTVDVDAVGPDGGRSRTRVEHVQGLPAAATPVARLPRLDQRLERDVRALVRAAGGSAGVWALDLGSGRGAAWNGLAEYPGASSLKLAVAVVALAAVDGVPAPGSRLDGLLRQMLIVSDNAAANAVEAYAAGSTSAGSARVNAMMAALGLPRTDMYGGYARSAQARRAAQPIPLRVDDQPWWGRGKRSTAYELGALLRAVWLASGGKGPLRASQPGLTPADARYLLYLLARVGDRGKLGRYLPPDGSVVLMHKAGWISTARNDTGLLAWRGGIVLVSVMTYRGAGVGTREDELAGRVAQAALRAYRG